MISLEDGLLLEALITTFNGIQLVLLYRISDGVKEAARLASIERSGPVD